MKKVILPILLIFILFSCQEDGNFTLKGNLGEGESKTVYLRELGVGSARMLDSIKISENGDFEFNIDLNDPTFFILSVEGGDFITVVGDSSEVIDIKSSYSQFSTDYTVEGSEASSQIKILNSKLLEAKTAIAEQVELYSKSKSFGAQSEIKARIDSIAKVHSDFAIDFVKNNPFSLASHVAIFQTFSPDNYVINDIQAIRTVASALSATYGEMPHIKALYDHTLSLLNAQKQVDLKNFIAANADNSPDIVLPDLDGKEVALSSLRGKVVLIQFWHSQNAPSRIQNPVLVDNYKKYHSKGFEIYQVAVDKSKESWKRAIENDKLTWINVCDLEGSSSALASYNVQSIPYNYLLDGEGNILAQNLIGPKLDQALSQILK